MTSGNIENQRRKTKILMNKFDALNFSLNKKRFFLLRVYQIVLFILLAQRLLLKKNFKSVYFNFKEDIAPKDIWGGQCIS